MQSIRPGMSLKQMTSRDQSQSPVESAAELSSPERFLSLVVEGAALGVPEIDSAMYGAFRSSIGKLALHLPDRLPDDEKLAQIRSVVREFEGYRKTGEEELRNRTANWRSLVSILFRDLLKSLGINPSLGAADQLLRKIGGAVSAAQIEEVGARIDSFLHPSGENSAPAEASKFQTADHSTANLNAAGLRGGGSAIEHLKKIMEGSGTGFIVLFRLSCLNMINQRFGSEAVEDCLMAVAAFLTQSLHADDVIYHWSDSSLLAILQGRANDHILTAELERIAIKNRETSVNIGGRPTMLRIPITFDLTPIERLQSADDLCKITLIANGRSVR